MNFAISIYITWRDVLRFIVTALLFSALVYAISRAGLTPIQPIYTASIIVLASAFIAYITRPTQCSHTGNYRELMSCEAVCCDCNEKIGFIGTVRDQSRGTNRKEVGQQSWS